MIFVVIPDLFLIYFYSSLMFLTPDLFAFVLMMWFVCSSSAVLALLPSAALWSQWGGVGKHFGRKVKLQQSETNEVEEYQCIRIKVLKALYKCGRTLSALVSKTVSVVDLKLGQKTGKSADCVSRQTSQYNSSLIKTGELQVLFYLVNISMLVKHFQLKNLNNWSVSRLRFCTCSSLTCSRVG